MGLDATRSMSITSIAIASDSQLAANIIKGKTKESWQLRNLVKSIKNICNSFHTWKISHCFRETNRPADWLARKGRLGTKGVIYFTSPLEEELQNLVTEDANDNWYQRFLIKG